MLTQHMAIEFHFQFELSHSLPVNIRVLLVNHVWLFEQKIGL